MGNVMKRTTMMVRDMERSLVFFRDILGAKVWFDRPFTLDGGGLPIGKKGDVLRLCIIQFNHDEIGMMGLMEFIDPVMPAPEIDYSLGYGKPVFVVIAEDAQAIYDKATKHGFKTRSVPKRWSTTGAKGETKHFLSANLWDGDGHFFECNQVTHIDWPEEIGPA
jgi:catechol 2,3-dioxygenase-like lactoylglutathione lyase family enzyme